MSTVDLSPGDAPEVTESEIESAPAAPQRTKPRGRLVARIAAALLVAVVLAGCVVGGWSVIGHRAAVHDAARDARALSFAMDAVAQLVSTDSADPNGYVNRVLANSTGSWHDEFDARKRSVVDTMHASGGVTKGHGVAAGIERRNGDGSMTVLVVVSSETSVPLPQPGPGQGKPDASGAPASVAAPGGVQVKTEPEQYQLRVDVAEVGGKFKLSKVGFVR